MQKEISLKRNLSFISKKVQCIIEEVHDNGLAIARSYADAPEVDGLVYIKTKQHLTPSQIVDAEVIDADSYDLIAEL